MRSRDPDARFLLVRHGETEWNVAGRRQGLLDSPLTPAGIAQAEQLAARLANESIDAIFCSPLGRAQTTAEPIADHHSLPITVLDELAELDMGRFSGLTDQQIDAQFPGALAQRSLDKYNWCFPGGESYAHVDQRSAIAIQSIAQSEARSAVVIGHSMTTRMVLRNLLNLAPDQALQFDLPHGEVLEVTPKRENPIQWLS